MGWGGGALMAEYEVAGIAGHKQDVSEGGAETGGMRREGRRSRGGAGKVPQSSAWARCLTRRGHCSLGSGGASWFSRAPGRACSRAAWLCSPLPTQSRERAGR